MIPDYGRQSEHFKRDCAYARVRVAVRRAPVAREAPAGRVVDELRRPAELAENLKVAERRHVRVRPSMHGDVVCTGA